MDKWYVVHTYSGYEQKVKEMLEENIKITKMEEYFGDIVSFRDHHGKVKGQVKKSQRTVFPGYIIVNMVMNDTTWHFVRNTPKVTGFVGYDKMNPPALPEKEVNDIINAIQEGKGKIKPKIRFEKGDGIKVTEGPFTNFTGNVEEIKPEKGKVKVLLNIFGRTTPVELDFIQIEKI